MKEQFKKKLVEGWVLVHGHEQGIQWFTEVVEQYWEDGEDDSIVAVKLVNTNTKKEYGKLLGVWITRTKLFWEVLWEYWGVQKNEALIAMQIESTIKCTSCQQPLLLRWNFCPNCRAEILDKPTNQPEFTIHPWICKSTDELDQCVDNLFRFFLDTIFYDRDSGFS